NYIFLLDFEGQIDEKHVQEAINELRKHTSTFKVFGSYPRATGLSVK
ncbi:MAG: prephenate dehydratase, partial [Chloroflexi bacterium]|nr:prephenate dehydratase [Chloroflexota bacterium]